MDRRTFVIGGVATLAAMRYAEAQQSGKIPRVGLMLMVPVKDSLAEAFRQGLRELGYIEGQNINVVYRTAEGRPERLPGIAAEMVRLKPDVIVSGGGLPAVRAAMQATRTIPIVFPAAGDPVADGLVQSLARPGGNATGLSILTSAISLKLLQLLKELLPGVKRVAVFQDPAMGAGTDQLSTMENAASPLRIQLQVFRPGRPEEYEGAFGATMTARAEALIVLPSSAFSANRQRLIALSAQHRLVTIWQHRLFTDAGGLLSYGPDFTDMYRGAAKYVDKILKGAKPAELPVEQATKLELVINLKTAKTLGLKIPGTLLVRADQVIQ